MDAGERGDRLPERSLLKGLHIEPQRVRVDRNRVRFVVFLVAFVLGSAVLLTLAFIAVPGSLIGLVVDWPPYYSWLGIVVGSAFGVLLLVGSAAGDGCRDRYWARRGARRAHRRDRA